MYIRDGQAEAQIVAAVIQQNPAAGIVTPSSSLVKNIWNGLRIGTQSSAVFWESWSWISPLLHGEKKPTVLNCLQAGAGLILLTASARSFWKHGLKEAEISRDDFRELDLQCVATIVAKTAFHYLNKT